MVDGNETMETDENSAENVTESNTRVNVVQQTNGEEDPQSPAKTTTISTIAVQSGDTRIVIALLQSGEWLRLKILEVEPELTKLGATVEEATELSTAHDEVLLRLQSKQSPVEELLKQADQLISTQKPRAEVYAAMAETLGQAWRDVNELLERRKRILDSNLLFQCRAEECKEAMKALEMACNDTLLPIEIEAVKNFLSKIHDLRKIMLETLMGALQEGKTLLDRLKEIANEGTLDSRPERIKIEAEHAVLQVERWLEGLHDRRRLIEVSFRNRKTQLEQCLALALLATDLRDLEEILSDRIAALSSTCDQLGDSSASAQLLLFELKKLQNEAKDFQDRAIKITKSTEKLVSSGHFAGEQATEQAYAILSSAADYVNDLEQYENLLNRAIGFFDLARSALTKLDQLEIQLVTTEHPDYSMQLARFHEQTVSTIEEVTSKPLTEGYALLDATGRGAPGAIGVKRIVEELENRKIRLLEKCTAHEKENMEIARIISNFNEKHGDLRNFLENIVEAFLRGHQDMGSDLIMAQDFYDLHQQLMNDLNKRYEDVQQLVYQNSEIRSIDDRLSDSQRSDIRNKISNIQESWNQLKNTVLARIQLGSTYVLFHEIAQDLENDIHSIENELKKQVDVSDEQRIQSLMQKWNNLRPVYSNLSAKGKKFLDDAGKVNDLYLDIPRACLCVESILERFGNRQLTLTESWESWKKSIEILKERRLLQKRSVEESTRTLEWVSKFEEQLYPVITSESTKSSVVLQDLESSRIRILPELNKAVEELESRIKSIDSLIQRGEVQVDEEIARKLMQMNQHLRTTTSDYKILLDSMISVMENLQDVERKVDEMKHQANVITLIRTNQDLEKTIKDHETMKDNVTEILRRVEHETDKIIGRIKQQEPPEAARQDVAKLQLIVQFICSNWQVAWSEVTKKIEEHRKQCTFCEDLERIERDIEGLNEHLKRVDGKQADSLRCARMNYEAFSQFEKTITILEERINTFTKTTEEKITITTRIRNDLSALRERWEELKKRIEVSKKRMNSSIEYFKLLEEAEEWFKEGSKLLMTVARKATVVKEPQDAKSLLNEIDVYLKPGEEIQEKRIENIRELSTKIFGTDRLPQFNQVVVETREMLDSFTVVTSELRTLIENLKNAADLKEKMRLEREEANIKLNAAKVEAAAAEAARLEAENARKIAEQLAAETLEKAATEAKKLKEIEREKAVIPLPPASFSVSAQTDKIDASNKIEQINEKIVQETITSAVTTKEIHIMQKMEVQETVPSLPIAPSKKEASPVRENLGESVGFPPKFILPLNDATIQEGERLTFECRVTGTPRPEVVWYKDGISILNNPDYLTTYDKGICTLTIEETFAEDSAKFTCMAFNLHGSVETSATLTVKETAPEEQPSPPVFVKELVSSEALEGSTHRLECTVEGNPLPTVQWFKNDTNIDNSPDYIITYNNGEAILKFEEVFLEDKATYTCKATNRLGQASTSAYLNVQPVKSAVTEKPYFMLPLSNAMARAGQRVKLDCEAKGVPLPELIWTHDGRVIEESNHTKIQTDGGRTSLIISEAFPKDAGSYSVTARNPLGEAQVSCNVSVKGRLPHETSDSEIACSDMEPVVPKVQLPLQDVQVYEGRTVRLDCVIVGQPEPEVIWYHDNQPVKESADFQLLFQGDKCSLIIHEAFLDDAGVYKVVAINSGGEASSQCTLTVTPVAEIRSNKEETIKVEETIVTGSSPKFVKLPTDSLVADGEGAVFECSITGEPRPDLKWFRDNNEIVANDRIRVTYEADGRGILKISSTKPEDKGNYTAKATNIYGEAKAFARLIVRSLSAFHPKEEFVKMEEKLIPPYFKERFDDRFLPQGISTKFECIARGKPAPKIQWLFNDKPVHGKDFLVSVSGERQVLTIPETEASHSGVISCLAENAAGKAICSAKIEVESGKGTREEAKVLEVVQVPVIEMQASNSSEKHFSQEKTSGPDGSGGIGSEKGSQILTKMSSTITQSSTTHMSTRKEYISSTTSSTLPGSGHQPTSVCVKAVSKSTEQSTSENGAPPVVESHKVEEFEKIVQEAPGQIRQEKTVVTTQGEEGIKSKMVQQMQKPCRKSTAPRFVSPVTGMIVDQGTDVVLEGIIDGFPQPTISWTKNGQELKCNGKKMTFAHNRVRLELKDVAVKDAGRYTCTAVNNIGSASSTADLVVKKTIFPPVFGRRLQAQVVKCGDRVIMEVEITGTPEPTVTWYKDDVALFERPPEIRIKQQGNCYMLLIDKAEKGHAGKYMVRATNAGGEAQSIADFAVFEPTPDTMVEVHKTVVYENLHDKNVVKSDGNKGEIPSANLTAEHISTTTIQPSSCLKTVPISSQSASTIRTIESEESNLGESVKASRSETISSTTETHQSETKTEQKFHMKLEHEMPPICEDSGVEKKINEENYVKRTQGTQELGDTTKDTFTTISRKVEVFENDNENIETAGIAKKDALSFFESMNKDIDSQPKGPKEMIKLSEETGGGYDVKVDKLTKSYEKSTKVEELKKPESYQRPQVKKSVQDIFSRLEQSSGSSSRGIDNKLIEFPYEGYKLPPLDVKRTVLEDTTASGSPIHASLTISKLAAQTDSAEAMLRGFNLVPEPPPEIGYMPKEQEKKKLPDVSTKAKQLQQSFDRTSSSTVDAPIGGIKLFPTSKPSQVYSPPRPLSSSSEFETHVSTDLSEYRCHSAASSSHQEMYRSTSPKPSADGIAMEKSWARKSTETRRSWPPPKDSQTFTHKQEWQSPENYKTSSQETREEVELTPCGGRKTTNIESLNTLEKKSWSTKEDKIRIVEKQAPPPPPPIIYKAETTKVDHTVHPIEEKSIYQKYVSECDVRKTESTERTVEENYASLKAPGLVKSVPRVQMYHVSDLEPGPPPEIGFIPGPVVKEKKIERIEKSLEMSMEHQPAKIPPGAIRTIPPIAKKDVCPPPIPPKDIRKTPPPIPSKVQMEPCSYRPCSMQTKTKLPAPPTPTKFVKGSFGMESDYESDMEGPFKPKWRPYESDNDEPRYRKVKAPIPRQPRPKSTEPEPLPPSSFEVPPPELTGPPRPTVTPDLIEKPAACKKSIIKKHEIKQQQQQQQQQQQCQRFATAQTPIVLKPGSPPIYVQPKSKPESPKFKVKTFQQESGYMADTDEPLQQRSSSMMQRNFGKHEESQNESRSLFSSESKFVESSKTFTSSQMKDSSSCTIPSSSSATSQSMFKQRDSSTNVLGTAPTTFKTPKETVYSTEQFSHERKYESTKKLLQPSPSPSKFITSELRESDYESDNYERRVPSLWKPSTGSESEDYTSFKSTKTSVTAGSPWPSNGVPAAKEIVQPYLDILPKKAPLFITPLRDIAVVSGQTARFECIVQAEPQPNILWSKDGRIIENSANHEVYYRNGVCRLTIPRAFPEDAGTYACTATNSLGSSGTSSTLQVPGNRRSVYGAN